MGFDKERRNELSVGLKLKMGEVLLMRVGYIADGPSGVRLMCGDLRVWILISKVCM